MKHDMNDWTKTQFSTSSSGFKKTQILHLAIHGSKILCGISNASLKLGIRCYFDYNHINRHLLRSNSIRIYLQSSMDRTPFYNTLDKSPIRLLYHNTLRFTPYSMYLAWRKWSALNVIFKRAFQNCMKKLPFGCNPRLFSRNRNVIFFGS